MNILYQHTYENFQASQIQIITEKHRPRSTPKSQTPATLDYSRILEQIKDVQSMADPQHGFRGVKYKKIKINYIIYK